MKKQEAFEVTKTDAAWREDLSPAQYEVLRQHGTERRGSSTLNKEKRAGEFVCAGCGQPLFSSETKYESGTGWPSFFAPLAGAIATDTGQRYCMNGVAMNFTPKDDSTK